MVVVSTVVPLALGVVGFAPAGVAHGVGHPILDATCSFEASWDSCIGGARAASLFDELQTMAATGQIPLLAYILGAAIGAATAAR
jgi:hypothetical protein